jgi:Fic family protein
MEHLSSRIRERLDKKVRRLSSLRPLSPIQTQKLREQLEIEMTYNSNAIEGNSLTLRETYLVLQEGITIKGKPLKDHLEAKDHKEALDFLYDLVQQKKYTISSHLLRQLHQLVVRETEGEWAGKFRTGAVMIAGAAHLPPEAVDVPRHMDELILWLKSNQKKVHPVELAALFHHQIANIHPFFDGNGRTARLAMNIILMRYGYPLAIILKADRSKYYRTLQAADKGKMEGFVLFVAQAVERSLDLYLRACEGQNAEKLLCLSEVSRGSPYNAKYLNLLARTGKISASKRGRIWYTSKKAIEEYRRTRKRNR